MSEILDPDLASATKDDRRGQQRQFVRWPVLLGRKTKDAALVHGRTMELSPGGMRIVAEGNFASGETLICRLNVQPLRGNNKVFDIDLQARVVHVAYSSQAMAFEVGLQFQAFSGDGKARLAEVFRLIERGVAPKDVKIVRSAG